MKSLLMTFLGLLWFSVLSAQVTFESDTVFLSSTGTPGVYEGAITINSSSADLSDIRWERIERVLEPLVWTGYVYSCDSVFFPFTNTGPLVRATNTSTCFLGANITNLEGDLPREVNQFRLRLTSVSDPNLDQILTYILLPVPVSTREVLSPTSLQISPNPAKGVLAVSIEELADLLPANLQVYNSQGVLVYKERMEQKTLLIETAALAEGLYFLQVETTEGMITKSFLKRE